MYNVQIIISFPPTETTCASHITFVNDNCDVISVALINKCNTWKHNQLINWWLSEKKQSVKKNSCHFTYLLVHKLHSVLMKRKKEISFLFLTGIIELKTKYHRHVIITEHIEMHNELPKIKLFILL